MSDFLRTMAELSAERARAADPTLLSATFEQPLCPLQLGSFDVIAEIKDRSPAEGELATGTNNRAERAQQYAQGGAAAISVLTEPSRFSGSLEHLEEVVAAVPGTPVMRKDFLVAPIQILEARKAGAGQQQVGVGPGAGCLLAGGADLRTRGGPSPRGRLSNGRTAHPPRAPALQRGIRIHCGRDRCPHTAHYAHDRSPRPS